jgi:hypothetical protein
VPLGNKWCPLSTRKIIMGKVLLTGMSAPQASAKANVSNLGFASLINKALISAGHEVVWTDPNINFTKEMVDTFDSILVGISPLTSLGSNRVYGALSVIGAVLEHAPQKLSLLVDAPNVSQIEVSLRAAVGAPESLVKPFYSYRKNYAEVKESPETQGRLLGVVRHLLEEEWPTTIYPSLPWKLDYSVADKLPTGARSKLVGLNLDSFILEPASDNEDRAPKWVSDDMKSKWNKSVVTTLQYPCSPMKMTKGWTDYEVEDQIARSIGALIAPDKKQETWWTYRYVQAMNKTTPIATNWYESQDLGAAWAVLAASIESASEGKRRLIATAQRESYEVAIPDTIEATKILVSTLGIN